MNSPRQEGFSFSYDKESDMKVELVPPSWEDKILLVTVASALAEIHGQNAIPKDPRDLVTRAKKLAHTIVGDRPRWEEETDDSIAEPE